MAKPIPHYRRNYKAGHEGQTAHELLTTVLLAGLRWVAREGDFETYGELFREVDFLLPRDVPPPDGLQPYPPRGGIPADIRSQKPTATTLDGSSTGERQCGGRNQVNPGGESMNRKVAKKTPGPMSGGQ